MQLSNPVCFSTSLSNSGLIVRCIDQSPRKGVIVLLHISESGPSKYFPLAQPKASSAFEFKCPGVLHGATTPWPFLLAVYLEGDVRVLAQLTEDFFVQTAGYLLPLWADRLLWRAAVNQKTAHSKCLRIKPELTLFWLHSDTGILQG